MSLRGVGEVLALDKEVRTRLLCGLCFQIHLIEVMMMIIRIRRVMKAPNTAAAMP